MEHFTHDQITLPLTCTHIHKPIGSHEGLPAWLGGPGRSSSLTRGKTDITGWGFTAEGRAGVWTQTNRLLCISNVCTTLIHNRHSSFTSCGSTPTSISVATADLPWGILVLLQRYHWRYSIVFPEMHELLKAAHVLLAFPILGAVASTSWSITIPYINLVLRPFLGGETALQLLRTKAIVQSSYTGATDWSTKSTVTVDWALLMFHCTMQLFLQLSCDEILKFDWLVLPTFWQWK